MGTVLTLILVVIAVLVVFMIAVYNSLIRKRVRVDEAWSDIKVQLKRRADLIPNLISTVKGYAAHEKGVFEQVTKLRNVSAGAQNPQEAGAAENMFQQTMKSLFAVAENYPNLKADKNFQQLQADLTDTEDKIQASRRFYNGAVRDLNTKIQIFPNNIFAAVFGFKNRDFFEVDEAESADIQQKPDVDFQN